MIEATSIERLKTSIDIVDVIGNYLELKKSGANFKANCPFHGEKTPSFVVSPQKQIFHCFGCGVGGDAIKFVMEIEKLNYPEAIEKLASNYNIPLSYTKGANGSNDERRVLELMQHFYKENLTRNSFALEYLEKRGIAKRTIEHFGIGYVGSNRVIKQHHVLADKCNVGSKIIKFYLIKSNLSECFIRRLSPLKTLPTKWPSTTTPWLSLKSSGGVPVCSTGISTTPSVTTNFSSSVLGLY